MSQPDTIDNARLNRKSFAFYHFINLGIQFTLLLLNAGLIWSLWVMFTIYPCIRMQVRRLHDINKRGWWALLYCIPVLGPILCSVVLFCIKGTIESNRYGTPPANKLNLKLPSPKSFIISITLAFVLNGLIYAIHPDVVKHKIDSFQVKAAVYDHFRVYTRAISNPSARMRLKATISYDPARVTSDILAMLSPGLGSLQNFSYNATREVELIRAYQKLKPTHN